MNQTDELQKEDSWSSCKQKEQGDSPQDSDFESKLSSDDDQQQENYMHVAVLNDEIGVIESLLQECPNLANKLDLKGHTPLSLSIKKGRYRIARILIESGVDVCLGGGIHTSNLHLAALSLQWILSKDLILRGADPNAQDVYGDTPLHSAARGTPNHKVTDYMQEIIIAKTDINKSNMKGRLIGETILEVLCQHGNLGTLTFCHQHNLLNIQTKNYDQLFLFSKTNELNGNTLLHIGIEYLHIKIVVFLLKNNLSNILAPNYQNFSPDQLIFQILHRGGRKNYNKCILMAKLIKTQWYNYLELSGMYEDDEPILIPDSESQYQPYQSEQTQTCNFSRFHQNIVNPKRYIQGGDLEEECDVDMELEYQSFDRSSLRKQQSCDKKQAYSFESDSSDLSSMNEHTPKGLHDILQQMKQVQPHFQPKSIVIKQQAQKRFNVNFNLVNYTKGDDPYESPPPDEESVPLTHQNKNYENTKSLRTNKTQKTQKTQKSQKTHKNSNTVIKMTEIQQITQSYKPPKKSFITEPTNSYNNSINNISISQNIQSSSARGNRYLQQNQTDKLQKNRPRQLNFSPNNIKILEARNSLVLHQVDNQKPLLSLVMKRFRRMVHESQAECESILQNLEKFDINQMELMGRIQFVLFQQYEINRCLKSDKYQTLLANEINLDQLFQTSVTKMTQQFIKLEEKWKIMQDLFQDDPSSLMKTLYLNIYPNNNNLILASYEFLNVR